MISDLRLALVQCPEALVSLKKNYSQIHQVSSSKDLVRLLIDADIDVIVYGNDAYQVDHFQKIYKRYSVPAAIFHKNIKNQEGIFDSGSNDKVTNLIERNENIILASRVQRENKRMKFLLEKLSLFTNQVIHSTKEMFVTETKKFFKNNFKVSNCHWVEVKESSSKLPPILKLRQELEKQKVDQTSLIKELNDCATEVVREDEFQVWKTQEGLYMAFVWVPGPEGCSQCIVLNKFKIENRLEVESFLAGLVPFLRRRWSLCLTVEQVQEQIDRDSLTGLYNQKFLNETLDKKIEEYKRYKTPFSVLFIDVDHFKKVNDSLGHLVGSGVLTQMGGVIQEQIRNSDYAFRYGGDEFIVLLSHTDGTDAVNVAERIREKIEKQQFCVSNVNVNVTVSIGLAFFPSHADSAEDIVRIADEAMYYGKNKSRNIVYKAS